MAYKDKESMAVIHYRPEEMPIVERS